MTQEDIIRMAREAGLELARFTIIDGSNKLKRFAALVAAAEREACAKVCESEWAKAVERMYGEELAEIIRARGQA